jgi:hypothetical protein
MLAQVCFFVSVLLFISHVSSFSLKAPVRFYFDMAVENEPIGRLEFHIPDPNNLLPLHTENLVKLCTQERRSIDPLCHYINCFFQYSPTFIQGLPQYRWSHTLKGRGRNSVGRPEERILEPDRLRECSHSIFGGTYYGLLYENIPKEAVVLTVPTSGPGRGSTSLSLVRVAESPPEWKERLLVNSAVLGWLDPACNNVLELMARQTRGPPQVVGSGILEEEQQEQ